MAQEIARVLTYPKIIRRLQWDEAKVSRYVGLLRFEADMVSIEGITAEVPRDPQDAPILATLIASKADCLVTGDEDLLSLSDKFPILTPAAFLQRVF